MEVCAHWYGQLRSGCDTCAVSWCARLVDVVCVRSNLAEGGLLRDVLSAASFGGLCARASVSRFSRALCAQSDQRAELIEGADVGVCALVLTAQWV